MEKFICKECNNKYSWVLQAEDNLCVYCKGSYPDGTICKGGNHISDKRLTKKE